MQGNKIKYTLILLVLIILVPKNSFAQKDKKSLQNKYNTILKDIKGIENLIEETETRKTKSLHQLRSLSAKINSRETLIGNINDQIGILDETIAEKRSTHKKMNLEIEVLKDNYSKMIYHSYKNLNTMSLISFLLSSDTFNQALRRLNYLKSYAITRQSQALELKEKISVIEKRVEKLEAEKIEKESLLIEEQHQKSVLITEKSQKNNLVTKLKDASESLKEQIDKKNSSASALNNQIQRIIREEIIFAQKKAKEEAAKNSVKAAETVKKESKLSKDFVNNKGRLPWPVTGHIVEHFGTQSHPTLTKVSINNNGIDIRTEKGRSANAIFTGVVVNSFYLPTTQNTIILKHGEYFTVYSNLITISVNLVDEIKTGQPIGKAYTSEDNITKVHLEIWKSINKLDPEMWIKVSN